MSDQADAFLLAHAVAPLCFDLSGSYLPASIRDQMLRGYWVAQRLFVERILESAGSPILIVGAGVTGVTAAITCARYGAMVHLIEASGGPFRLQRGATSRHIDPTQYDFPLDHWREGRIPWWVSGQAILHSESGKANAVAASWELQLRQYKDANPNLTVDYHTKFTALIDAELAEATQRVTVKLESHGRTVDRTYAAVLFCHGFGRERYTVGDYDSSPFWSPHVPYATHNRILISGSGDGALQDFLLAATGKSSAREIFETVVPDEGRWGELQRRLHSIEDQAQRSYIWSAQSKDHEIFEILERDYTLLINDLLERGGVRDRVAGILQPDRTVTLAHECSHFGRSYSLNRFLGLLLLAASPEQKLNRRVNVWTEVPRSASKDHHCANAAHGECWEYPHIVSFTEKQCRQRPSVSVAGSQEVFDYLIFRHGVEDPTHVINELKSGEKEQLEPPFPRRHLLPYIP